MSQKVIGVLGGMGPAATADLFNRIIDKTVAEMDREHVNMIITNDPQIPDRTEYILGEGESPIPQLIDNLSKLHSVGAEIAIMPCMTAHTFIEELKSASPIPLVNGIELVEQYLTSFYPNFEKIGLLATNGSIKSQVFQKYISKEIITPNSKDQAKLMDIIYGSDGIKSGNVSASLVSDLNLIINKLRKQGIQAVIVGCTELSLVINKENVQLPVIDPVTLLAMEAVKIGNNYTV